MLATEVVLIAEGRVERVLVHLRTGLGVVRLLGGLVEQDGLGARLVLGARQGPVIAIGAQRQNGLGRVEGRHPRRQRRLEPVLRRRRSGLAAAPVLVIGHQHDRVGGVLQRLDRIVVVRERRRDPDLATAGLQDRAQVGDEPRIGARGGRRQLLEVDDVAGVSALGGLGGEIADQGLARRGIEQHGVGGRPVPGPRGGHVVEDARQDRRRPLGRGDDRAGLRIGGDRQLAVDPGQRHRLRRDHIELVDVVGQGFPRTFVPRHIESDGQGPGGAVGAGLCAGMRNPVPLRPPFQLAGVLLVQRRKHLRILERHLGQPRRKGQGGEEGGDHQGAERQQQAGDQTNPSGATSGRVMEDQLGHQSWRARFISPTYARPMESRLDAPDGAVLSRRMSTRGCGPG